MRLRFTPVSWIRGLLAAAALSLAAVAQQGNRPVDPREVLQQAAERRGAQTSLPGEAETERKTRLRPPEDRPGQTLPRGRPREGSGRERANWGGGGSGGGFAKVFGWLIVVATVVMLAVAIARAIADRRRTASVRSIAPQPLPEPTLAPPPPLADYEQLARAGRFAEAVHALLLHAFVRLAERRGRGWPRADTGREILAAVGGFAAAEAPLQLVFRTAETAWFGAVPVDREQYERCLQSYLAWRAV